MSRNRPMGDAQHLRAQAELCLNIARLMSDPKTADGLQAEAAHHLSDAVQIEEAEQLGSKYTPERG